MKRYEFVDGTSSKFWEYSVAGSVVTVRYGRIGTAGQTKDKDHDTPEVAAREAEKLVREKLGKGYSFAGEIAAGGSADIAPFLEARDEGIADAATARFEAHRSGEPDTDTIEMTSEDLDAFSMLSTDFGDAATAALVNLPEHPLETYALPTRLRRHGPVDTARAGEAFLANARHLLETVQVAEGKDRFSDLNAILPEVAARIAASLAAVEPSTVDMPGFVAWAKDILTLAGAHYSRVWPLNDRMARKVSAKEALTGLAHCLVASKGALDAGMAGYQIYGSVFAAAEYSGYRHAWAYPAALALRSAIVHSDDASYDEVIEWALGMFEGEPDLDFKAYMAFIIADDRDATHRLQALPVLAEAAPAGLATSLPFLCLVADARPSAVRQWRARNQGHYLLSTSVIGIREMAGTLVAVARRHGEPSSESLDWLLYHADGDRPVVFAAILDTGESDALKYVLPLLNEKAARDALDQATHEHPARTFCQLASALVAGRTEPALKARFAAFLTQQPKATLLHWAEAEPRVAAYVGTALAKLDVAPAQEPHWPVVLRETPWRNKNARVGDIVLALGPIPTGFAFDAAALPVPPVSDRRGNMGRVLDAMAGLRALFVDIESVQFPHYLRIPQIAAMPAPGTPEPQLLAMLVARFRQLNAVSTSVVSQTGWNNVIAAMERQPEDLALVLWETIGPSLGDSFLAEILPAMLHRYGERALPGILARLERDPAFLAEVVAVSSPGIVPYAARALVRTKKARLPAMEWLRVNHVCAVAALLPVSMGPIGADRSDAEIALRWLTDNVEGARGTVTVYVALYEARHPGAGYAFGQVLDRNPLTRFPARIAKLPEWVVPAAMARPELRDGKGQLPDEAVLALAEMLSFSTSENVYAGVHQVKDATTPESIAAFAWDLFSAWLAEGAPAKEAWAMRSLGWLGDDECARQLTKLIRKWPGEAAHARAVTGLDVLVDIGSEVALMSLNGIAEKLKFKGLQEKARERIASLAEARGLTADELSDRMVPDFDMDENGGITIDFGPRQFRGTFDGDLKPMVFDPDGKRVKDLPKPAKSDDVELATAEAKRWSVLKKDAKSAFALQSTRLESMLSKARRIEQAVFTEFVARHPLMGHMAYRLVWGAYSGDYPGTAPDVVFRLGGNMEPEDVAGKPVEIPSGALVGLVHPLHLDAASISAWKAVFKEDGISQAFPQLDRPLFALTDAERSADSTDRFKGLAVEAARLRGVSSIGWQVGAPQDAGVQYWLEREVRFPDGKTDTVILEFSEGIHPSGDGWQDKIQHFGTLSFDIPYARRPGDGGNRKLGELDPVTASELFLGPSLLVEKSKGK